MGVIQILSKVKIHLAMLRALKLSYKIYKWVSLKFLSKVKIYLAMLRALKLS